MNKTFEANFTTTGSPTIKIYKIYKGVYTLVKTDTMSATPETGKYSYEFVELDQLSDYSARMELGDEKLNGVYNGIFSQIFAKQSTGGGGGEYKMTKEELERITKEMGKLLKESLENVEISLPDELGEKEISKAVGDINSVAKKTLETILVASKKQGELLSAFSLKIGENNTDKIAVIKKIDEIISSQKDISDEMKGILLKKMEEQVSSNDGRFKQFAKLLGAFREEKKKESRDFARLLGAFRNEMKK